jgi:hypothetical protein
MYNQIISLLTAVGDWLFFAGDDGVSGKELWKVYGCDPLFTFLPYVKK